MAFDTDESQKGRAGGWSQAGNLGGTGLEFAEGQLLLASGGAAEARPHLERAMRSFQSKGLRLWAWRAGTRLAEAASPA